MQTIMKKYLARNKTKNIDFYHSNAVLIALLLPITLSFISLIILSKIL